MRHLEIRVPVSPDMEEIIFEHAFGGELGFHPGEKTWMIYQARKRHPGCTITSAQLDIENGQWVLGVTLP